MTRPDRAAPGTIWLGDTGTSAAAGWLPVLTEGQMAALGVYPPRQVIGPTSRDSEQFVHTWVTGNFGGGVGVENMDEGADTDRCFFALADTRGAFRTALPPQVRLRTAPTSGACYPLGDVFSTDGDLARFACAWDDAVYATANGGSSWSSIGSLPGPPQGKGAAAFKGTDDYPLLYVPCGAAGFATVYATGLTSHAADSTHPAAVSFMVDNTALYCVDVDGVIWLTVGGDVWEKFADHDQDGYVQLDGSETPRRLVHFMNRAGTPTPYLVSNRAFYELDLVNHRLGKLHFTYPPHPHFGEAVEVFRPGEDLHASAGLDVLAYASNGVVDPDKSPTKDDGLPEAYLGRVRDLQAEMSGLWALVQGGTVADNAVPSTVGSGVLGPDAYLPGAAGAHNTLLVYDSIGWHGMWADDSGTASPTWMGLSAVADHYGLFFGDSSGACRYLPLNPNFHNPKRGLILGSDAFQPTGFVETARFDGNMQNFAKVAIGVDVKCDWATSTETVTVSYQTDADVLGGLDASAWHVLGTVTSPALTSFDFDLDGDGHNEGLRFGWIRLRYDLARGNDETQTPLLDAANLRYTTVPQNTQSFRFVVELPKRRWKGRTAGEIDQHLQDMLVSDELVALVHQNKTYAVRVSGVSGTDNTGEDRSGRRDLTVIAVRNPARAEASE